MKPALAMIACAATLLALPGRADACTYSPELTLAEPVDGAIEVPTNVVPWLWGRIVTWELRAGTAPGLDVDPETFWVALRSDAGDEVPIDLVRLPHADGRPELVEIRPQALLAPRSRYVVRVQTADAIVTYSFTTGDGPLDDTPEALGDLSMQVVDQGAPNSCGQNTWACIGPRRERTLHVTARHSGAIVGEYLWHWPEPFRYVQAESTTTAPFCIELRARNLAGGLGPPFEICSADSRTFTVEGSVSSDIACDGHRIVVGETYLDEVSPAPADAGLPVDAGIGTETASDAGGGGCSAGGRAAGSFAGCVIVLLFVLSGLGRARGGAWAR